MEKSRIIAVVAIGKNRELGNADQLLWHIPDDLRRFHRLTKGHPIIMGRKTFESILARLKKPLPGRKNVVITRQTDYKAPDGVLVFSSLNEAVAALPAEDLYIIGGSEIYALALPLAQKLYMTHIRGDFEGDAFFPEVDWSHWQKIEDRPHENFTFAVYKKKN